MKNHGSQRSWSGCVPVCFRVNSADNGESVPVAKKSRSIKERLLGGSDRNTGGIRAISFVLANESFERLATFGLFANFMVYLIKIYNLEQVSAANVLSIWMGVTNFAPLAGAFVADAYTGRFWTIAFASFFSLLGMLTLTLTAWAPGLHPPTCSKEQTVLEQCIGPTGSQMGALILGLVLLSIGSGGIRPCSIPFGVDQYDPTTDQGRKGIASFFNWYYTTFTIVVILAQTVILYIQDQVSWVLGFGIPTLLMGVSIFLFFFGARYYNYVKPEGSAFTGMAQVAVAAFKKRGLKVPEFDNQYGDVDKGSTAVIYDPPVKGDVVIKLARTRDYRFLDKAALVALESELTPNGEPVNKWRLTSIQSVEEFKCLIRVFPIWACGVIGLTAMTQQWTFNVSQALIMDRHIGNFEVPAGTVASVISLVTVVIFIPVYDRYLVPAFRKITGHETGITLLQRIGIGIIFAVASMGVAGTVERIRRHNALSGAPAMSAFWLSPHLVLMGLCEAFNMIGLIEFFNRQFPDHMRSVGNALFPLSFGMASYLSTAIMNFVRRATLSDNLPGGWLANDLNHGRYDYFYFLLAALGVANLALFVFCACRFRYKEIAVLHSGDLEMSDTADEPDTTASLGKA